MAHSHTSFVSGSRQSLRRHLRAGATVASAGILAASLVVVTPDGGAARAEVHSVQLAAIARPLPAPWARLFEEFIRNGAQTVVPDVSAVPGGAADVTGAVVTAPPAPKTVSDPAIGGQQLNSAALATTADALAIPILDPTFIPVLLLFGPLIVGALFVNLLNPLNWILLPYNLIGIVGFFFGIPFPVIQPFSATAMTTAPGLTSDPPLTDPTPVNAATGGSVDPVPVSKNGKVDVSPPVTPTQKRTHRDDQMTSAQPETADEQTPTGTATSKKDVAETAKADETTSGTTAVKAPKPSASGSASEPAKPGGRPATSRSVLRGSFGMPDQLGDQPNRGNGGHPTPRSAAGGKPSAGGSSDGDADGS